MNIELTVSGMTCAHCKTAVEGALKRVGGVSKVEVDLERGAAHVEGESVNLENLIAAVQDEGYNATVTQP